MARAPGRWEEVEAVGEKELEKLPDTGEYQQGVETDPRALGDTRDQGHDAPERHREGAAGAQSAASAGPQEGEQVPGPETEEGDGDDHGGEMVPLNQRESCMSAVERRSRRRDHRQARWRRSRGRPGAIRASPEGNEHHRHELARRDRSPFFSTSISIWVKNGATG